MVGTSTTLWSSARLDQCEITAIRFDRDSERHTSSASQSPSTA